MPLISRLFRVTRRHDPARHQRDTSEKLGKRGNQLQRPATIIAHVGRDRAYVTLAGKFVRWSTLVADAWADDDRPAPLYRDGVVITLDEYREWLRNRAERPAG